MDVHFTLSSRAYNFDKNFDLKSVNQVRHILVPPHSPEALFEEVTKTMAERDLFVPGQVTLARSNAEEDPIDMELVRQLRSAPYSDIWKRITGLRPTPETKAMKQAIYPSVKKILNEYWKTYNVHTKEIDLVRISGWNDSEEGAKTWLQLSMDDGDVTLIKQMAKEVGRVLEQCGYANIPCIIMQDDYDHRSDTGGFDLQQASYQPIRHYNDRTLLDIARHFSFISGNAIGPCDADATSTGKLWEGTLGAYYTNGKNIIGISNSHVVGNQGNKTSDEYRDHSDDPKTYFQMPSDITYDLVCERIDAHIEDLDARTVKFTTLTTAEAERTGAAPSLARFNETVDLQHSIIANYDTVNKRCIGHTLWASGLTYDAEGKFGTDVGLIMLNLEPGVIPENKMPVVGHDSPSRLTKWMQLGNTAYPRLKISDVDWVVLRPGEYASERFLSIPPNKYLDGNGLPGISIMKTGKTSGSTAGILNGQTCDRSNEGKDSLIWVEKYTATGIMGRDSAPFSKKGDSGSLCVTADEDGQPLMVGFVTGGKGQTDSTDKTFIYPFFHFAEKVMPMLIREGILPPGPKPWSMNMSDLDADAVHP